MDIPAYTWKGKATYKHGGWGYFIFNAIIRLIQCASGLACLFIYYSQIHSEKTAFTTSTPFREWAGLLAGADSSAFAPIEALPWLSPVYFPLDFVAMILYSIVFACYEQIYLTKPLTQASKEAARSKQTQLLDVTIFDGAMMGLWTFTFIMALVRWHRRRKYNQIVAEQA